MYSIYNPIFYPLCTSLLFSGSFVAAKYTTYDLQPLTTTLLRYLVAFLFLSCLIKWNPTTLKIQRRDLLFLLLLGLFGIVGYHYFFFLSLHYTTVANTAIINAMSPIITGLAAGIVLKEKLLAKNYIGILFAFSGVLLLLSNGNLDHLVNMNFNKGDLLMFLSVLCWVVYALLVKKMVSNYSSFALTFYATLFGVIILFFLVIHEGILVQLQNLSSASLLSVIYMGVFASGMGYLLYNSSIQKIGPTKTASFVYSCVPVFVTLWAFLFFNQTITLILIFSVLLIVLGLHFMLMDRKLYMVQKNE